EGRRERALQFQPARPLRQRTVDGDQLLLEQPDLVRIVPAQAYNHAGLVGTVLVVDPFLLTHLLEAAAFLPEVDAADALMAPPEGAVMAMVRGRRMAQARERPAGGADNREEERPGVAGTGVPAEPFLTVHLEGDLVVRLRHELHLGDLVGHGGPNVEARKPW